MDEQKAAARQRIESMLKLAGFATRQTGSPRVDAVGVAADIMNNMVFFDCSGRATGGASLKEAIAAWNLQKAELGVDRVVLVTPGTEFNKKNSDVAENNGITLWDGRKSEILIQKVKDSGERSRYCIGSMSGIIFKDAPVVKAMMIQDQTQGQRRELIAGFLGSFRKDEKHDAALIGKGMGFFHRRVMSRNLRVVRDYNNYVIFTHPPPEGEQRDGLKKELDTLGLADFSGLKRADSLKRFEYALDDSGFCVVSDQDSATAAGIAGLIISRVSVIGGGGKIKFILLRG